MSKKKTKRNRARSTAAESARSVAAAGLALTPHQRCFALTGLVVWCACSLLLAGLIPRGDAPDEAAHLGYIDQLADTWTLVDFRTQGRGTEAHQPPLYYALCAAVSMATGGSLLVLRAISTVCGLALIVTTFALARAWRPTAGFAFPAVCAAAVGFLPMNLYVCSAVNNDPLVNVLVALGLLHMWHSRKSARGPLHAGLTGGIAGLAMLTKSTALALAATGIVWFAVQCAPQQGRRRALWSLAAFLVGLGVLWGPWAAYNTRMYGDPLAAGAFSQVAAGAHPAQLGAAGVWYWIRWVAPFAWFTLWGAYDHLIDPADFMPMAWYLSFAPIALAAAWGAAGRVRALWADPERRRLVISLAVGAAVLMAGFVSFNRVVFQAQARYFFCYLPAFSVLLCGGLDALGGWKARIGLICLLVLLAAGCLDGLAWRMWS